MLFRSEGEGVFNGDVGTIVRIVTTEDKTWVYVEYDDGFVIQYSHATIANLELYFASSIHSSQGSTIPVVICVVNTSHWMMCNKQLLYTAVSRAKDKLFLVADTRALNACLSKNIENDRRTFLKEFVHDSLTKLDEYGVDKHNH